MTRRRAEALTPRRRWLLGALMLVPACRNDLALTRDDAIASPLPSTVSIDLGSEGDQDHLIEGFFPPERVGRRNAAWSDGRSSVVSFGLKAEPRPYLLSFLAEPYFKLDPLHVSLSLNDKLVGDVEVAQGWNAYSVQIDPSFVRDGSNQISFKYSRTARPIDLEPTSSDTREISVRIDQIQLHPIGDRVQLGFHMGDALTRVSMADGWAIDANDRFAGVWTTGPRAVLNVRLARLAPAKAYKLQLTSHCQAGMAEQKVIVSVNGKVLGQLAYSTKRSTQSLEVPSSYLRESNEIQLSFDSLKSPAQLNPKSSDVRLLGLRVLNLLLEPSEP